IDLKTTGVVGFEALMRWQHPERGLVPPVVFIPLAEQSDLILELGVFALHEAVAAASRWPFPSNVGPAPYVTVNLSAHQFRDPNLVKIIETELHSSKLAPERLIIEITESVTLLYVAETLSVMEDLNHMGVGFALDDFGTGYSSLSYLALTHPKIIKIDQSFVSPAVESLRNDSLLEAIVMLGEKLDMTMLAEGIETSTQLERLQRLGCEFGQGFLFAPAVPAEQAALMIGQFFKPGRADRCAYEARMNLVTALAKPSSSLDVVTSSAAAFTSSSESPMATLRPETANMERSLYMSPMVAICDVATS